MNDFQKENMLPPEATSTKMFDLCMEALKNGFAGEKKKNDALRSAIPFGYDEYKALLAQSAHIILQRRRERNNFVIDPCNEPMISQLYLYLRMDERFAGDLRKGVMLIGKYGSGKTLIMQAMVEMYNAAVRSLQVRHPLLRFVKSSELLNSVKEKPIGSFSRMPPVIDEFGREPK
jgi:DNA replication protein DnaC